MYRKFIICVHGEEVLGLMVPLGKNPWSFASTYLIKMGVLKLKHVTLEEWN